MSCGRDPVEPVRWTFQHSPDSTVTDISSTERFHFHDFSLIIYKVEAGDSGTYSCTDTAGELHATELNVIGKLCALFFYSILLLINQ